MSGDMAHDERLVQAKELVRLLEAGDDGQADAVLRELTRLHEASMFQELGRLTRQLHEAINGFLLDDRLQALADHEMRDAAERLSYVIEMTEKSANTTLGAVEEAMPLLDTLTGRAAVLDERWQRFCNRELSVEEFRDLTADLSEFFSLVGRDGTTLGRQLNAVLMAQDFQDLTGQIIRKVINLVQDVEDKLVQIIRLSGVQKAVSAKTVEQQKAEDEKGHGPVVPGVDAGDAVHGQDEVDDLLSSLGF
jgi:chemotaxis protein CheZ